MILNKRVWVGFLTVCLVWNCWGQSAAPPASDSSAIPQVRREMRGLWVATIGNMDWPSGRGLPAAQQKAELLRILDLARDTHFNAIILQVRPACDALYDSKFEPWSEFLTGKQGKAPDPSYDPLAFAVEEAHKRGLELHAWFNPYRAWTSTQSSPAPNHISVTRPELVKKYGRFLWLDPGEKEVQQHTLNVVLDVVSRYDIDAVHFDDYFYPYAEKGSDGKFLDFPDDPSWQKYQASGGKLRRPDWRRENVNQMIQAVAQGIKSTKPTVRFGISPFGIWKPDYPTGVQGMSAYDEIYCDSRKWIEEGWVDYLVPQLYWSTKRLQQNYKDLLRWWVDQNKHQHHVFAGNIPNKIPVENWPVDEVLTQLQVTRQQRGASGNVHFSAMAFTKDAAGLVQALAKGPYAGPALMPASSWLDNEPPAEPKLEVAKKPGQIDVSWQSGEGEKTFLWVVYAQIQGTWRFEVLPGDQTSYTIKGSASVMPTAVAVSAVDRLGNESEHVVKQLESQN